MIRVNQDLKAAFHLDRFRLEQPHIKTEGVWCRDGRYFLVCPEVVKSTATIDEAPLSEWFDRSFREMCFPLELISHVPSEARKVPPRTRENVIKSAGTFRNNNFLLSDLAMELPVTFPEFILKDAPGNKLLVARELTDDEFACLESLFERFALPVDFSVEVDPLVPDRLSEGLKKKDELETTVPKEKAATLEALLDPYRPLTLAKYTSKSRFSHSYREALQEDERYWVQNREQTLAGFDREYVDPVKLEEPFYSRGILDLRFNTPVHINNYYSIFHHLFLVLPTGAKLADVLSKMSVTESEIRELIARRKLTPILASDIRRYPQRTIEAFAEGGASNLVLPRKLAAVLLQDAKTKFPILYPPLDVDQMSFLLAQLYSASKSMPDRKLANFLKFLSQSLSWYWQSPSTEYPYKGTDSIAFAGFGNLLSALWGVTDESHSALLSQSLLSVQMASAFDAVQVPDPRNENLVSIGASIYSGVNPNQPPEMQSKLKAVIENLFTISSHIPVNEFVGAFQSSDINRLKRYVFDIARQSATVEEAAEVAASFNEEAKRFEARKEFFGQLDLAGFLISVATPSGVFVPPTTWITTALKWLFRKDPSGMASSILDIVDSIGKTRDPRAVLVARMKKNMADRV